MLGEIGTLQEGACADIALLELREESCELTDCTGETRIAGCRLVPARTVRAGRVYEPEDSAG